MPALKGEIAETVTFEFEVFCGRCGAGICGNCTEGNTTSRRMPYIQVDPCEKCEAAAEESAHDSGYSSRDKEVSVLEDEIADLKEQLSEARKDPQ